MITVGLSKTKSEVSISVHITAGGCDDMSFLLPIPSQWPILNCWRCSNCSHLPVLDEGSWHTWVLGSHNGFLIGSLPCTEDNKTHWWVGWNQLLSATQGEIREGRWKNKRRRKPERHWMKKRNCGDTRCQAVGPRPGCNEDHCPRSARRALLSAPLFDHEPGCSCSSMWKYLVCCRRECLGKEIGRPAFLQPHSPDPPHIPWRSASATAGRFLGGSFLISLSFAQIKWRVNVVLISALWFKIRDGGITGWMWESLGRRWKSLSLVSSLSAPAVWKGSFAKRRQSPYLPEPNTKEPNLGPDT